MTGLCKGGNEPPGSLKDRKEGGNVFLCLTVYYPPLCVICSLVSASSQKNKSYKIAIVSAFSLTTSYLSTN